MNLFQAPDFSSRLFGIPDGPAGIAETLSLMAVVVRRYKVSPQIRHTAVDIVSAWPEKDEPGEVEALHNWVRDQVRYVKDIEGVETISTPDVTLATRAGDCDDKSVLLASLLASIGYPVRFVALGYQRGVYVHVLVETCVAGVWFPLETTEPVDAGWTPPDMPARLIEKV